MLIDRRLGGCELLEVLEVLGEEREIGKDGECDLLSRKQAA